MAGLGDRSGSGTQLRGRLAGLMVSEHTSSTSCLQCIWERLIKTGREKSAEEEGSDSALGKCSASSPQISFFQGAPAAAEVQLGIKLALGMGASFPGQAAKIPFKAISGSGAHRLPAELTAGCVSQGWSRAAGRAAEGLLLPPPPLMLTLSFGAGGAAGQVPPGKRLSKYLVHHCHWR